MDGNPVSVVDPMGLNGVGNPTEASGAGCDNCGFDSGLGSDDNPVIVPEVKIVVNKTPTTQKNEGTHAETGTSVQSSTAVDMGPMPIIGDPPVEGYEQTFGDWIRGIESMFGSVMVWGEGKGKGTLIGSERGGATSSFDVVEFEEMMGLITDRLRDRKGKGILASQKERLETIKQNLKDDLIEQANIPGLIVTDKQKAKLIVDALVQAGEVLNAFTDEEVKTIKNRAKAYFDPNNRTKAPVVNFSENVSKKLGIPDINHTGDTVGVGVVNGGDYKVPPNDTISWKQYINGKWKSLYNQRWRIK